MKNSTLIFILIFSIFQFSCKNKQPKNEYSEKELIWNERENRINNRKKIIDSINVTKQWKKIKCGLWKSNNGDLGLKTIEGNEQNINIDRYITTLCCEGKKINEIIDTLTFTYLGNSFYKDRYHIYTHYIMSDGGNFWIVENADVKTFEILGDCYARDKKNIFCERKMIIKNVDYKTFKTKKGIGCFAKDKNGYYFWDTRIDTSTLNDTLIKKVIIELDKIR